MDPAVGLGCARGPQSFHGPAARSAGQGCAVVVVEQAVCDEGALRVQGAAGPAEQDLAARTHPPAAPRGCGLRQRARLLLPAGPPAALPVPAPPLLLGQRAAPLGAEPAQRGDRLSPCAPAWIQAAEELVTS